VAANGWGKGNPVRDWLYDEPHGFDFFQAVRLLELDAPDGSSPVGEGAEPALEAVRFRSGVGLDFPASDVAEVRRPDPLKEEAAPRMTVNFMGLAGATGPLDAPLTELIIDSDRHGPKPLKKVSASRDELEIDPRGDGAPRAFLDIFNHRLVSLLYRTRKLNRVALDNAGPGRDRISSYLYSAAGLGMRSLRRRMCVQDRALLFYAGLVGQHPRSAAGLEAMLSHYFGVRAVCAPFKGRWRPLEKSQWTRIGAGKKSRNARLGVDTVVGTRVWDEESAFEMELGPTTFEQYGEPRPMTFEQFKEFLPTGWAFRPLCDLVRFYVGDELDFSFRLKLVESEVPSAWLARRADAGAHEEHEGATRRSRGPGGARLGWTSRLNSRDGRGLEVVVSPASLRAFRSEVNVQRFGLPPDKLEEFVRMMTPTSVRAGLPVPRCKQGEAGEAMFAVRSGRVKLTRRGEDGAERHIKTLGPGEYFGEMALITDKFRRFSAFAVEDCELLELSKEKFDAFTKRNPHFNALLDAYADGKRAEGKKDSDE
jgi:type VI secretion system protein ImpH